ncbi:hypothetical protein GPAL_0440 [Glaciecola pallidula DSM 14239 = ACAM 615]|uniref:Transposase DDE domain-containing protein n=1 Tax=Brumicola pallidula DSM 14239 = ACAM 615 TaxID=1121922 RepID=K6ZVG4_9ALTE|nr:hypothetical protein GPAL_0440 [Glaciecola pallidula DSM 14239 = ACAM 615]
MYKKEFPNLLSYTRFLAVMPRVIKSTMGWFYGFKIHLIVNYQGEIVAAKVTTGNVHDAQPVEALAQGLTGKLYGDKGYLSKALEANLFDKGVALITTVRKHEG